MSSDAAALPRHRSTADASSIAVADPSSAPEGIVRVRAQTRAAALGLITIVALSLFVVLIAANRPSVFSATTHIGYFPGWMAGPLGGLLPWMTRNATALKFVFTGALVAMYVSYLLALFYAPSRLPARWAIAAVVGVHAIFFLAPPMALTDIFNYVNYGRMEVVHHLNPYTSYPVLEPHGDPSYALSNWHQLLSPYGPLFTLLTFALVPLGVAASFWAIKAVLAAASLGTILLVWKCARMLRLDPVRAIVLVGLNPIVLIWGLGGDHNDFLIVFCIVLGFYLLLRAGAIPASPDSATDAPGRSRWWPPRAAEVGAGAAFVAATALKASGGILIPIVLVGLCRAPRRLVGVLMGMVAAGAVLGVASLLAFGLHIPDLSTQSRVVTNISIPNLLGLALGSGGETETLHSLMSLALAATVIGCCVLAWRNRESITPSGWATVALLVTLGWVLPWYVLWLLPLAALSRSRRLRATTLVLGAYLVIAWAPASSLLWNAIGFQPAKTPLGRLHQRYVRELLN